MRRRTFEEMITYFNQTVSGMDIDRKYKMTLLGIVTALLQKHDEDVAEIVRCKDCKYASPNGIYGCRLERFSPHDKSERLFSNDFCSLAEVKADEAD